MFKYISEITFVPPEFQITQIHDPDPASKTISIIPRKSAVFRSVCCDVPSPIYDKKPNPRLLKHLIIHGVTYWLSLPSFRLCCSSCQAVRTAHLPFFDGRSRHSEHFAQQIIGELKTHSIIEAAKRCGIGFNCARGVMERHVKSFTPIPWPEVFKSGPIRLGVDGHSFRGHHMELTIFDLTNHRPLAFLNGESRETLDRFLMSVPSNYRCEKISEVCTDLTTKLRGSLKTWLPNAKLTADKFHVIALMNRALDEERKALGVTNKLPSKNQKEKRQYRFVLLKHPKKLKAEFHEPELLRLMLLKFPSLKLLYELKQKLYHFYENHDREIIERVAASDTWNRSTHRTERAELMKYNPRYRTLIETIKEWKTEIENICQSNLTNGFAEGIHTKFQLVKRISYGFKNIDIYRRKLIIVAGLALNRLSLPFAFHTC